MLSAGVLIGGPATLAALIAGGVIIGFGVKRKRKNPKSKGEPFLSSYEKDGKALIWGGIGAIVLILVIAATSYWPYKGEYHSWRTVEGIAVVDVQSRFVPSGDNSVEQKFVVKLDTGEFGCLDTRCALVKKGDDVKLSCKKVWQWSGTAGDDCNFVYRKPVQAG